MNIIFTSFWDKNEERYLMCYNDQKFVSLLMKIMYNAFVIIFFMGLERRNTYTDQNLFRYTIYNTFVFFIEIINNE